MAIKYFILHIYLGTRGVGSNSTLQEQIVRILFGSFLKILMSMCEVWQLVIQQYVYKDVSLKPDMGHLLHQSNNRKS